MPFKSRADAREKGRRGALALHAKRRAAKAPISPYTGTVLDLMDAAGLTGPSWAPWRAFWRVVYGLPSCRRTKTRSRAVPAASARQ